MVRIGLDYDLSKKVTNRNIVFGNCCRDFLPAEIIWVHSPLGYREKIRYSHYYGISYVDKSGDLGGNWTFALALDKQYTTSLRLGLEAEFWNIAVFRAGLSGKIPTLGAGVHYKRYYMDYAFRFDKIDFHFPYDFGCTFLEFCVDLEVLKLLFGAVKLPDSYRKLVIYNGYFTLGD